MHTRQANADDLDQLSSLFDGYRVFYKQTSDLAAAKEFISQRIESKDSIILVAVEADKSLAGFTQLYPSFTSVGMKKIWVLNDLFVNPNLRKKGVAKALMSAAKKFCKESGRSRLALETGTDNIPAQKLYEQLGYSRNGVYVYSLEV